MDSTRQLASIVLAAGKGTRMKSDQAKVLHEILGRPMLHYVLDALQGHQTSPNVIVVGHQAETVRQACGPEHLYAEQVEQHGTGHAVQVAMPSLDGFEGRVLILYGDMPLLTTEVLQHLASASEDSDLALLTAIAPQLRDFGRIVRRPDGTVEKIVEAKDCTPAEFALTEVNLGVYCARIEFLREFLGKLSPNNAQGELYLTDLVGLGNQAHKKISAVVTPELECSLGVNSRADLAKATGVIRARIVHRLMLSGVTVIDPNSVWVEPQVQVGPNTELWPGTILQGSTVIGENNVIGPNTRMTSAQVGCDNNISYSVLLEAKVGNSVNIGPFAYLRPGAEIGDHAKVGDFVEIKNSTIGDHTKVPHLTYVGDSTVGSCTNIGCGTITCNYDGVHKHHTVIGDHVLIGSNTSLVAPVTVGAGARTGAGSVITKDVAEATTVVGVPARRI